MKKYYCISCAKESTSRGAKYCKTCCSLARSKSKIGNNNPRYKEKIKTICKRCHKIFQIIPARTTTAKFCSRKCRTEGLKKVKKLDYCKACGKRISKSSATVGNHRCKSCSKLLLWKDSFYRNKMRKSQIKGLKLIPNNKEKKLNKVLQDLFKNEYKFVGSGKIIIDGFNPDFININGQKKIIELFGDYWHNRPEVIERDKRRINAYNRYGYDILIIKEHELENTKQLINKLTEFNKDNKKCVQTVTLK